MPTQRKIGFVERPDAEIYYECVGAGPAVVFAHGLGGNHLSWWQQVPHFAERHTCIVFAHRGFTPSKERPGGGGAEAYADDLNALLDHLGIERASLVCQSMGGWTGIDFALRWPGRVAALVLASTSGRVDFATVEGPETAAIEAWKKETAGARDLLLAEGVHPAFGARGAREQPTAHFLYQQIDALTPPAHKERIRKQIFALRNLPASTLRKLALPVLYIVGEEDVVSPAAAAPALARLTPGAKVERVPQSGHSVYFERPQRFNALVEAFLAR